VVGDSVEVFVAQRHSRMVITTVTVNVEIGRYQHLPREGGVESPLIDGVGGWPM
jgi:hypothetical protein